MTLVSTNLKVLRKKKQWTQEQCADKLGIKRSLVGAYEEGRADPPLENLLKISKVFDITVDELVTTDLSRIRSQMFGSKKAGEPGVRILSITVDEQDRENVELVQQKAAAGYLNGYGDPEFIESLPRFRLPLLPSTGTYRAFEISGDSMLPMSPGSIVVGKYLESISVMKDGSTGVVVTEDEGVVYKRLFNRLSQDKSIEMVSDNASYPSFRVPADQILEIWSAVAYISKDLPDPSRDQSVTMDRLADMMSDLKKRVEDLKK